MLKLRVNLFSEVRLEKMSVLRLEKSLFVIFRFSSLGSFSKVFGSK